MKNQENGRLLEIGSSAGFGSVVDAQYHLSPCGWWKVCVLLRRADKTREWQHRASFMNEEEAHQYARKWTGVAETKVSALPNSPSEPRDQ